MNQAVAKFDLFCRSQLIELSIMGSRPLTKLPTRHVAVKQKVTDQIPRRRAEGEK